jgi:hypothetical protein
MIVGETAKTTGIISVASVSVSRSRYPKGVGVAPSQAILEEHNKLSFPRLPRESAEALLNKELAIYADEQEKIQRAKT